MVPSARGEPVMPAAVARGGTEVGRIVSHDLNTSDATVDRGTLDAIAEAPTAELDAWYDGMDTAELDALPPGIHEAVAGTLAARMRAHVQGLSAGPRSSASIPPDQLRELNRQTLLDFAADRGNAEGLRDAVMSERLTDVARDLSQEGYYVMALFDSGNGGIAASKVFASMIGEVDGLDVRLVVLGDHQMQPYGSKSDGEIAVLVNNGMLAADNIGPDVTPFACNTACTAIQRMKAQNPDLIDGLGVEDLIVNTARVVSDPRNEPFYGTRPMILSTEATRASGMYSDLIAEFSAGRVAPHGVGASDGPTTGPQGEVWTRDLATLVNQLAHLDPGRAGEVQSAVDHYVGQMPRDITSVVLCCTHYPELAGQIRTALDARGMQDVQIINPMTDQALISLERLSSEGIRPRRDDPDGRGGSVAVSSAINKLTARQVAAAEAEYYDEPRALSLEEFMAERTAEKETAFADFYESVPALAERNWPAFTGQLFAADFYADRISDYVAGRISAVDVATMGFNGRKLHTFFNTNGAGGPGGVALPERNGATNAASALRDAGTVMIGTGFNVPAPDATGPAQPGTGRPETDGPLGAAVQARTLLGLGKDVHLVGDEANVAVMRASLEAIGVDTANNPALTFHTFEAKGAEAHIAARDLLRKVGPDVVQMIEVPGRNADGARTNMGNINIDAINPDLDAILLEARNPINRTRFGGHEIKTIGVGDGGNEAGMGDLDLSGIAIAKPSIVPADIVVTAENSNLGGYAIAAELSRLSDALDGPGMTLSPGERAAMLDAAIAAGAVDGVHRRNLPDRPMVDGFDNAYHERILTNLNNAVRGEYPD